MTTGIRYRSLLLLTTPDDEARRALDALRRLVSGAERLIIVVRVPGTAAAWFAADAPADLNDATRASARAIENAAAGLARTIEVRLASDFEVDALAAIAGDAQTDLLVLSEPGVGDLGVAAALRKRLPIAVLRVAPAGGAGIVCLALGGRARNSIARFLRDHVEGAVRISVVVEPSIVPIDLDAMFEVAGLEVDAQLLTPSQARETGAEILVVTRFAGVLLPGPAARVPLLVLPPPPAVKGVSLLRRDLDVPDVVDDHGVIRFSVHEASGIGRNDPIADQPLALVAGGRVIATIPVQNGFAETVSDGSSDALGLYRAADVAGEPLDAGPLDAVEQTVAVIRPAGRAVIVIDAELDDDVLRQLAAMPGVDVLAVRMRPMRNCTTLRARLHRVGLTPCVLDASAVLDEGMALDVDETVDPVRLARVAARLRAAGFPVAAIVHRGVHAPLTIGFEAWGEAEVSHLAPRVISPMAAPASLERRLSATTGAETIGGNRIELELDNARARRWLLEAIAGAKERVHLQVYMALDDEIGRAVEAAAVVAAGRGVAVRVAVDSLHGLHGSFGVTNPLLERLGSHAGIEVRVLAPVTGVPSLSDIKLRDHRKVAIVDGAVALVGGRNLSHEYYTGFGEVALTPDSLWREVPWLDAGARVEGPAVAAIERSFFEVWTAAGGEPFAMHVRPPAGDAAARVVVHHGLRDARTLEAYLALIDSARSHVYAVNGFPLILELQHALLRALRRGVRVRTLFGNLTPTHDGRPFRGPWGSARTEATELVHSRMDALIAEGADCHQFALGPLPAWSVGTVRPHVHAKVMSVDGKVCSVGSANLDITAGYWESELLLVVEDERLAAGLEATLESLIATSHRIERDDPEWQQSARKRAWMRHWPGVLSV